MIKAALSYFGHMVRAGGMEDDARKNEWNEKEMKTKTKTAGHTQEVFERSHHQQHDTRCQR